MTLDHYAKQEPKTCQPECACACHRSDSPACVACGGVDELLRGAAEQDTRDRAAPDGAGGAGGAAGEARGGEGGQGGSTTPPPTPPPPASP